ncbi:uncharacterized protein LAESUDRAFT_765477 [Laetiporus sulphureus 93-53]|uniref:Uncharacterized protein n=1 Tax=Laetiporus sulphureus 93-53 TaxID=1314785 RepID=A0A165AQY9_9APHY|nr:uncharacterized protein LAESUDRAFT_765477 [Laetiporus sulphureus 93-53]KZS99484.1 hypothetical protein LAESUDRAFT_765477 [Laetiporus sulphureus 93-53]
MPDKILQVHAGMNEKQWPTTWEAYLDWDLDIERRMKRMFTTSSRKDPNAMQVDEVKNTGKKKKKASTKGEVNATDKKVSVCKYCKKERKFGHRCEEYKKVMIKEEKWKERTDGGGGMRGSGPAVQRQKKYKTVVRCIEMQVTDDEEEEAESSRLTMA